jgi:hypothetical protein
MDETFSDFDFEKGEEQQAILFLIQVRVSSKFPFWASDLEGCRIRSRRMITEYFIR